MAEETVDHIFNAHAGLDVPPCEPSLLPYKQFPFANLEAIARGSRWRGMAEQAIPDVSELNLPIPLWKTCPSGV
jgi:hypothetical protein